MLKILLIYTVFARYDFNLNDPLSNTMKCTSKRVSRTETFTSSDYEDIYSKIKIAYDELSDVCNGKECKRSEFAGCIVRLAAHDFLDTSRMAEKDFKKVLDPETDDVGGMDGCLALASPENGGLQDCLDKSPLPKIYEGYCSKVSLPDFLVIAAESLISIQATNTDWRKNAFMNNFRYGRKWCGSPDDEKVEKLTMKKIIKAVLNETLGVVGGRPGVNVGEFPPTSNMSIQTRPVELLEQKVVSQLFYDTPNVFKQPVLEYNETTLKCNKTLTKIGKLTPDVVLGTALLGAHTLGKATKKATKYYGFWTDPWNSAIFNNNFYQDLLYKGYEPRNSFSHDDCPEVSSDNTCNTNGKRCRAHESFCDDDKGVCSHKRSYFQKFPNSKFHYDNRVCNNGRSQWWRSDIGKKNLENKKGLGEWQEQMLNTDTVLVHNYEQLSHNSECCAFFDADFIKTHDLDKTKACGTKENCCKKYQNKQCNSINMNRDFSWGQLQKKPIYHPMTHSKFSINIEYRYESYLYNTGSVVTTGSTAPKSGIALDAVIAFAKSEDLWLHYFHKAWYLATTNGQVKLTRMSTQTVSTIPAAGSDAPEETATAASAKAGGIVKKECFSWGCEAFESAKYFNEGFTNKLNNKVLNIDKCEEIKNNNPPRSNDPPVINDPTVRNDPGLVGSTKHKSNTKNISVIGVIGIVGIL